MHQWAKSTVKSVHIPKGIRTYVILNVLPLFVPASLQSVLIKWRSLGLEREIEKERSGMPMMRAQRSAGSVLVLDARRVCTVVHGRFAYTGLRRLFSFCRFVKACSYYSPRQCGYVVTRACTGAYVAPYETTKGIERRVAVRESRSRKYRE